MQILRWNRVGNFHHLFEKLAFFECKFYLEKKPLQKSTGLFSASSCCSCPSNWLRSCRNIRSISAHFPLYENVSTVEGAEVFIELLEPGRSNMAGRSPVAKRRSGNAPKRTKQTVFWKFGRKNGRNLLYICCRFFELTITTQVTSIWPKQTMMKMCAGTWSIATRTCTNKAPSSLNTTSKVQNTTFKVHHVEYSKLTMEETLKEIHNKTLGN